jgi:hypothetical protein
MVENACCTDRFQVAVPSFLRRIPAVLSHAAAAGS